MAKVISISKTSFHVEWTEDDKIKVKRIIKTEPFIIQYQPEPNRFQFNFNLLQNVFNRFSIVAGAVAVLLITFFSGAYQNYKNSCPVEEKGYLLFPHAVNFKCSSFWEVVIFVFFDFYLVIFIIIYFKRRCVSLPATRSVKWWATF